MMTKTHKARASRTIVADERLLWERVAATVRPFRLVRSLNSSSDMTAVPEQLSSCVKNGDILQPSPQPLQKNHASVTLQTALNRALPLLDDKDRKKIARGLVKMEARLDLHGLDGAGAHALLLQFISHAAMSGKRHVLIITGKGNSFKNDSSKNGELRQEEARQGGVLRQSVPLWLETAPFRPYVGAVEEAARHHGGAGALYVRLRRQKGSPKGSLLR